jgi:hypothetical protein
MPLWLVCELQRRKAPLLAFARGEAECAGRGAFLSRASLPASNAARATARGTRRARALPRKLSAACLCFICEHFQCRRPSCSKQGACFGKQDRSCECATRFLPLHLIRW